MTTTRQDLTAMTTAELDALLEAIETGATADSDPAALYDAALTERFSAHRGPFGDLPLTPSAAPRSIPMVVMA